MLNVQIICYIFVMYGLSNLLVYGTGPFNILQHFRDFMDKIHKTFSDMLDCMMCTSSNVAWITSSVNLLFFPNLSLTPFNSFGYGREYWYIIIFFDMCFTSGVVWLIHTLQEYLEKSSSN